MMWKYLPYTLQTVVLYCFILTAQGVNVALNRQTTQSSTYDNDCGSEKAVDGNINDTLGDGHCSHTGEEDHNPWFQVTFPTSNITSIEIYNRGENQQHRLMGFKLQLYNGDSLVNTYIDQEVNPQSIYTINYNSSLTASKALITQTNKDAVDQNPFVTICEIKIFGDIIECQQGFYGDDCFDLCSSHCSTTTCNRITGGCTCKPGYIGTRCDQAFDNLVDKCNITETGQVGNTGCVLSQVSNLVNKIKNVSKEDFTKAINEVSDVIIKLSNSTSSQDNVTYQIIDTLQDVWGIVLDPKFKVDEATFETLVSLTDIVTSSQQRIWQDVKEEEGPDTISSIISLLEDIAFKAFSDLETDKHISLVKNTIGVEFGTVHKDIVYPNPRKNHSKFGVSEHWIKKNKLFLSQSAFDTINSRIEYSVIVIKNEQNAGKVDSLTNTRNESRGRKIVSDILALSVNVHLTTPLISSVELTFGVLKLQTSNSKPACVFLKSLPSGRTTWSETGCKIISITDDHINCTCNHLTTFAVLASPFKQSHHNVLSSLTIAGCTVSIVCLTVTVLVYLYLWKYIRCDRSVLLVDLSLCMMIAYMIFVVGIDKTEYKISCKVVAICLHYCFLTVFCNFLSQSLALYTSLHSMTEKPRWILFLLLTHCSNKLTLKKILATFFFSVCPLIIVSITLAVDKTEGYGTEKYCWLSHNKGFIWSFLGPIITIIFVNGLVLLVVIRIAQKTRALEGQAQTVKVFSVLRAIVILTPLFGLTWIFGILSINDDYVVFQYLFVILNSFQGLFIFVIHCLTHRQVREAFQNIMRKKKSGHLDSGNKMTSSLPNLTSD